MAIAKVSLAAATPTVVFNGTDNDGIFAQLVNTTGGDLEVWEGDTSDYGSVDTIAIANNAIIQLPNTQVCARASASGDVLVLQRIYVDAGSLAGGGGGGSGGGVGGGSAVYSAKQGDCTVAYTSATELTLTGLPGPLDVGNFVMVSVWDSTGRKTTYTPEGNAFSWNDTAGVLTVANAQFAATDLDYDVLFWYTPKAYDQTGNQNIEWISNPVWEQRSAGNILANVTDGTDGTYDYAIDMAGYRRLGLQFVLDPGSGTPGSAVTCTVLASWKPGASTSADCVDVTSMVFGTASIVDNSATPVLIDTTGALADTTLVLVHVVVNTGGANDADWAIYFGRGY